MTSPLGILDWYSYVLRRCWSRGALPGLKLSILARVQGSKLPFVQALYVHIVMTFGAALTPGNSGGAPLAAITLNRLGIPLGQGISIAVQTIVLDLIFYAWTVPVSLVYLLVSDQLHIATGALYMAFLLVALLVVLAVVLVFYPRPLVRSLLWLSSKGVFRRFRQPLAKASREYYRSTRRFQALPLRDWLVLDVVTAVGWLANFVLFWALLVLFDNHARAPVVVAYLDLIQLVGNIVPTPGASGYMEAVVGLSTTNAQQETVSVAAPLLLWRLASFYVVFLLGPLASGINLGLESTS